MGSLPPLPVRGHRVSSVSARDALGPRAQSVVQWRVLVPGNVSHLHYNLLTVCCWTGGNRDLEGQNQGAKLAIVLVRFLACNWSALVSERRHRWTVY